jgi:predicted ATPase
MSGLLEREPLIAALDDLASRGGQLVFVGGEAGVGKTSLVRAYGERTSVRVVQGSCENLATPIPLGPFIDVAAQTGGRLAEVLGSGGDPRAVARAVVEELAAPAVVVLEDVHWADEATLGLLRPCSSEKARTSDVFPMPASPLTSTSRPFPAAAAARCSRRSAR